MLILYHHQKLMMNIWQPSAVNWAGSFDESTLPSYAFYDWVKYYAYVPGTGNAGTNNNFIELWKDDFDDYDRDRWSKASHSLMETMQTLPMLMLSLNMDT